MPATTPGDSPQPGAPATEGPLAREALARRKRRDAAVVLPLAGVLLFVSPLLDLMVGGASLFGLPVGVLYIFGSWFALIALTARLAKPLARDGATGPGG